MMDTAKKHQRHLGDWVANRSDLPSEPPRLRPANAMFASDVAGTSAVSPAKTIGARVLICLRRLFGRERASRLAAPDSIVSRRMFLAETQRDIGVALCAIETGDFDVVLELARRFKREGVVHDFPKIGRMGDTLARAILAQDVRGARAVAQLVMKYLGKAMDKLPAVGAGGTKTQ